MAEIYFDVDTALSEVPINIFPLTDDTDFKTRETAIAYNQAGMDLVWNFVTTAGAYTQTAVTPTTGGAYDWAHQGDGMYSIEIPASGGASINNDTEGFGWFTGIATGVLPWRSPIFCFRASGINDKLIDSAYSTTRGLSGTSLPDAAADAAGGLPISDAGGLDIDSKLAATNEVTAARMGALTDWIDGGRLDLLIDALLTRLTATRAGYLDNLSAGAVALASGVTVTTNNDKTGYALSTAGVTAVQSGLSTLTAQQVWEYATRTLSSFGSLVSDVVTAVWGATIRTLSAFGFSVTASSVTDKTGYSLSVTPPTAVQIRQEIDSNSTQLAAIVADTAEIQTELADGGRTDLLIDSIISTLSTISGYVDSLETRLTETRAGYLDELGSLNIPADIDTLLTRLSAVRTGYMDKLNITGNVAATGEAASALTSYDPPTKSELDTWGTALANYIDTEIASILGVTAKLDTALEADGAVYRFTANALEQAPSSSGGDATAANQTTIINHLTGIKGATFDTSTDSLEAIRNRGDAAWVTGSGLSGSNTLTLTIRDDSGSLLSGVFVDICSSDNTSVFERKISNSSGQTSHSVDDGTYYIRLIKSGYSFTSTTIMISSNTSQDYTMTALTISAPTDPTLCRIYTYLTEPDGTHPTTVEAEFRISTLPTTTTGYYSKTTLEGIYNSSTGVVYFDVIRLATGKVHIPKFIEDKITVPDQATAEINSLIL
jgi:hypothetical protein